MVQSGKSIEGKQNREMEGKTSSQQGNTKEKEKNEQSVEAIRKSLQSFRFQCNLY